ncbi:transposase [Solirubrobacter ginsenosidimutans]|uniref:Transposase n=1 Tax=Solirubrobacter ginsenosidimutans TaxID=490573 RepID=A0A9X3N060_9ACTN|nr:transposase [Solirubrobacter ginsenosidimutans]MDA0166024.1 transposase [Solirubrobacter ginsenosidimutans]
MRDGRRSTLKVSSDGAGSVSHAGSALLVGVAERTGLTRALSARLRPLRRRGGGHDPGRVLRDLAVVLADGGDCLSELATMSDQAALFGEVASRSTAFRVIDMIASDLGALDRLRAVHAIARARVWEQAGAPTALTIDLDAGADHRSFREGGHGRRVQRRLRVSPDARRRARDR